MVLWCLLQGFEEWAVQVPFMLNRPLRALTLLAVLAYLTWWICRFIVQPRMRHFDDPDELPYWIPCKYCYRIIKYIHLQIK